MSVYQHIARWASKAPALPRPTGRAQRVLRLAPAAGPAGSGTGPASRRARGVGAPQPALRQASAAGRSASRRPPGGPLAYPARAQSLRPARPPGTTQQPRSSVPRTTDSGPAVQTAPNRLLGQPAPNRVWAGDITYLPRQGGGWLYLAVWLDRCSRKIVGWDVRDTMPEDLVSGALRRALAVRQPPSGAHRPLRPRQPVHGYPLQAVAHSLRDRAFAEPPRRVLRQRPTGYDPRRFGLEPLQSRAARRR